MAIFNSYVKLPEGMRNISTYGIEWDLSMNTRDVKQRRMETLSCRYSMGIYGDIS